MRGRTNRIHRFAMQNFDQLKLDYLSARQKCVDAKAALTIIANQAKEKSQWIIEIAGNFSGFKNQEAILQESDWPTYSQISTAMADYRATRKAADNAWNAIPEGERGGLQALK